MAAKEGKVFYQSQHRGCASLGAAIDVEGCHSKQLKYNDEDHPGAFQESSVGVGARRWDMDSWGVHCL